MIYQYVFDSTEPLYTSIFFLYRTSLYQYFFSLQNLFIPVFFFSTEPLYTSIFLLYRTSLYQYSFFSTGPLYTSIFFLYRTSLYQYSFFSTGPLYTSIFFSTGPLYHECADLRVKGIVQTELKDLWKQRLISKCPERFANPQARSECEGTGPINKDVYSLDVSPDQLSRNWPVASTRSLLFYKNQACAKCHEDDQEDSLVFWGLRLSCEESPGLPISSDPSTILALVLRSPRCEVVFTTPVTMEPRECQFAHAVDPEKIIQQCNATGQRSQYDGVLWRSCQVFSAVSKLDEQVFLNPFCFWCQTDGIKDFRPPCPYGGSVPFFIVLSPDALESAQNDRASFDCRCKNGYIYNPYKVRSCVQS